MKRLLLLISALIFCLIITAQPKVDSLLRVIDHADDLQKTDVYLKLSEETIKDTTQSNAYNRKAMQLAIKNNLPAKEAKSFYLSAKIYYTARSFAEAILYYQKALELYRQQNDTSGMKLCYKAIGISNYNMSKNKEAISSYLEGLKLAKNDLGYTAELYGNIGLVHDEMVNRKEAIRYFRQALSIHQSIRDTLGLAMDHDYLGTTYQRIKRLDSSFVNYNKALYFSKKIKSSKQNAISLTNMAWLLISYPDSLNTSLNYFNKAWKQFQKLGLLHYEPNIRFGIARVYGSQGKYREAISEYKQSIALANQYKSNLFLKKLIYLSFSEACQKIGDYKQALENRILYSQYNDSVVSQQRFFQIRTLEKQYETEKKENEILRLKAKQELTNLELHKNRRLKQLGFLTAVILLFFVSYVLIKYFDEKKSKQLLEEKNRQIEKSEHELRMLNASKNKFFSIISHDLKNPFHTVMGYSYLLSHDYDRFSDKERQMFASDIHQSTNNIFRLLQNLLEWSKTQTGNLKYTPIEIGFGQILENSMSVLHPLAQQKNIGLKTDFHCDLKVFADPQMIETVLRNLINNGIKFTPENGSIEIKAEQTGNEVKISVTDSGVGISEEDVQNLFRIDSKVKRKGTNNEEGSGIGLILCKEFVDKNGGTIRAESVIGQGSSFAFTVPAKAIV